MLKRLKKMDMPLLIITMLLFIIGLVMIFSASNVTAFRKYGDAYKYLVRQGGFLIISIIASLIVLKFKTSSYKGLSWFAIVGTVIALVAVMFVGVIRGGAKSWFDLGPISVQPSEFAKIFIIMWMASYYDTKKDEETKNYVFMFFPIVVAVGIFFLIAIEPDLGTSIIFAGIVMYMFFCAPINKKVKKDIGLLIAGMIIIIALVGVTTNFSFLKDHQRKRIFMTNPCSSENFYTDGNQICNGYIAINNGGLFGLGLGNSIQKNLYLPEAYTDFIFCIIMEELGLVGAIVIILLYFLLIGRIIKIGKDSKTDVGAMLCYGVAVYILIHIIVNLFGIFGLIPMTGVPLPFMSYGGSYTICLMCALAMVQRVNLENYNQKELLENKKIIKKRKSR